MIKVRKKTLISGSEREITQYLPEEIPLTKDRRLQADRLDEELRKLISEINKDFDKLEDGVKKDELKKWLWLGTKLDEIFNRAKNFEKSDRDTHNVIWPAIGQYFREELKRGFDTKRSGEKKDHFRKCWLLATLKDVDWINSWGGWDAYVDRGDQLVLNSKLMPELKRKFCPTAAKLKTKDHQRIAKIITEKLPSGTSTPANIDAMTERDLAEVVDLVYEEFYKNKLNN